MQELTPVGEGRLTIREWDPRDRGDVQGLLRLLSEEAEIRSDDAPPYVAENEIDVRRRGIGRALVRYAIDRAEAAGASRVDWTAGGTKLAGLRSTSHPASDSATRALPAPPHRARKAGGQILQSSSDRSYAAIRRLTVDTWQPRWQAIAAMV